MLDELAALDPPQQRREAAKERRKVTETFAGVPDGRGTAHTLRMPAPHARLRLTGADPVRLVGRAAAARQLIRA